MGKLILVSNRLAVSAQKKKGGFTFNPSMGGLATGLSSLGGNESTIWIGWCGLPAEQLDESEIAQINATLQEEQGSLPVYLSSQQLKTFYYGFCNGVIWRIDYDKYSTALTRNEVREQMESAARKLGGTRVILSVDRLDYTKGIPQRLEAYDRFLESNPGYRQKVVLFLIVVPSRTKVPRYRHLKKEVEEPISSINGKHGTISWTPIHYFYRGFPFEELSAFYGLADVLLVTPLRDGMNLVAKEFVAARRLFLFAWQFILAAGNDATDEEVFALLPETAYSIKVGMDVAVARFYVESSLSENDGRSERPGQMRRDSVPRGGSTLGCERQGSLSVANRTFCSACCIGAGKERK